MIGAIVLNVRHMVAIAVAMLILAGPLAFGQVPVT